MIGYFLFWTCVFVLQFLNYLNGGNYNGVVFTDVSLSHGGLMYHFFYLLNSIR